MIKLAVCDDDPSEIRMIKRHADEYSMKNAIQISVDEYSKGEELIENYQKGKYDILFLDVEMDSLDGIATAEQIRRMPDHDVAIIYVSNYPEYMQASFNVRASQYLSKPLSYDTFESKINDIIKYKNEEKEKVIEFQNNGDRYYVNESDLISVRSMSKIGKPLLLMIVTSGGTFTAKGRLRDYLDMYSDYLVEPNRSILVNARFVHKFAGNSLILKDGTVIDISRNRVRDIKEKVGTNIMKRVENGRIYS